MQIFSKPSLVFPKINSARKEEMRREEAKESSSPFKSFLSSLSQSPFLL
jgi:hypothetical protein